MFQQHITKSLSPTSAPGLTEVLFAPKSWFATIAAPPTTHTAWGEKNRIVDDHVFVSASPAYGFIRMYTTPRSQEITMKMVGDIDSQGLDVMLEAFSPGPNYALLELMSEQDEYIVLARPADCELDWYFQIGQGCSGALARDWEYKSGKGGGEGKNGFTIKFDTYASKALLYEGAVVLATAA